MARFNYLQRARILSHSLTDASWLFSSVLRRLEVVEIDLAGVTNFSGMFNDCRSLEEIPQLDTSGGTSFESMFSNCGSLQSVPQLDTSSGTNFSFMFSGCSLLSIPQLDVSNSSSMDGFISGSPVSRIDITAWSTDNYIDLAKAHLSAASLNKIYTDLPETTTGTIAVHDNYGVGDPAHDPTIATAKGWQVYY